MRCKVGAALALMLALAAPMAWAQEQDPMDPPARFEGHGMMRAFGAGHAEGHMWQRYLDDPAFRERVGLTKEQMDKLRALGTSAAKARIRAEADMKIKRLELAELLQAEKPDRAAIDKKLRELADLHYNALKARADNLLAFREIVSADQREKIKAFVHERIQQRMREFRGMRPGMREGPRGPQMPGGLPAPPAPSREPPKDN